MLVKVKKDYAIIDVPKDKLETKDHEHKIAGSTRSWIDMPSGTKSTSNAGGKCAISSFHPR
jgi:hypothetical protein